MPSRDDPPGRQIRRGRRIRPERRQNLYEPTTQPLGRSVPLDVHREIDQTGPRFGVTVMTQALPTTGTCIHSRRAYDVAGTHHARVGPRVLERPSCGECSVGENAAVTPNPTSSREPIVLFDLDGTLTDSAPGIHAGFRHALAAVGRPEPTGEMLDKVIGPPMIDTFRSMGLGDAEVDRAIGAYFERYDAVGWSENAVFEGIDQVLATARSGGLRLAVATSKTERFAVRILEHFELAHHFEFIGGASNDGRRRAKSDVIAHTLDALGIAAVEGGTRDVVMVGDRDHDVLGAARWGIPAIFVEWGYGSADESTGARQSVRTVTELGQVLDGAR